MTFYTDYLCFYPTQLPPISPREIEVLTEMNGDMELSVVGY
jgi:hypothetical protein